MSENDNLHNADGKRVEKVNPQAPDENPTTENKTTETNPVSEPTEETPETTSEDPLGKDVSDQLVERPKDPEAEIPSATEHAESQSEADASNSNASEESTESKEESVPEPSEEPLKTEEIKAEAISEAVSEPEVKHSDNVSEAAPEADEHKEPIVSESKTENTSEEQSETPSEENKKAPTEAKKIDAHVDEIDQSNAEDAEDEGNSERHTVETKEYEKMTMAQLAEELETLVEQRKVQTIKSQVDEIKSEFNSKFDELLEEKKETFLNEGGNEIDFYYSTAEKKRFNAAYKTYRNNLKAYYKARENDLKANLENRLQIIEDIKGLINVEENINTTYKQFKDLQEQWRGAGPIPRDVYNNAWNSYHHQVEVFYDFMHLNRDLRDMDFKHNLEQKTKLIEKAEELAEGNDVNHAFRELQALHKLWKEDLGPVAKAHRDPIWERFSNATKTIHDKRQAYFTELDKAKEGNLKRKEAIILKIEDVVKDTSNTHQAWQKKIKAIEALRTEFFNSGRVPKPKNEAIWNKFKTTVRSFNSDKNAFYKNLKKDQYENLEKKKELIKIANEHKESDDFAATTPLMKRIQADWKKIGHVPRKDSDKVWKQFKNACNHYFDRISSQRNEADKELLVAYEQKNEFLDGMKTLELSGEHKKDIALIKSKIEDWKNIGAVPSNKRYIEGKFNKVLDALFGKLDMDKSKLEMIKFDNKLENLAQPDDTRLLDNEHNFIRKRIDEVKGDINQLENNLQFFSNVDETNPLVKEVLNNIEQHKADLDLWERKLQMVKKKY